MSNITYKAIVADLVLIGMNHFQIKSVGVGSLDQVTNDLSTKVDPKYTRMYVVPSVVNFAENSINYNFNVIILDKIEEDSSNLQDVMSDTMAIAKDIWTIFYNSWTPAQGEFSETYEPQWGDILSPFTERFETTLGGWTLQLSVVVPYSFTDCYRPITSGATIFDETFENFSSYKKLLTQFNAFATAHQQVNSFGFGHITQLTSDVVTKVEPLYSRLYLTPDYIRLVENQLNINFNVYVADIIDEDLSNQLNVLSDTMEIMKDLFSLLGGSAYIPEWGLTLVPFLHDYDTGLGGWTLSLSIYVPNDYNRCVVPIETFTGRNWEDIWEKWQLLGIVWEQV